MTAVTFLEAALPAILFFGLPALLIVLFAVELILFLVAKSKNKKLPGSVPEGTVRGRKIFMIVTAVMGGTYLAVALSLMALLALGLSNM